MTTLFICGVLYWYSQQRRQVLLVDFAVCWPGDELKISADGVHDILVGPLEAFKDGSVIVLGDPLLQLGAAVAVKAEHVGSAI